MTSPPQPQRPNPDSNTDYFAYYQLDTQITESELSALQQVGSHNKYPAGSILLGYGEETDFALLILQGHVKIVVPGPPTRIIGLRGRGEIVGEMAAIRRKPRSASIFAINDVQALYLAGNKWLQFLHEHPRAALAQLYTADERLAEATRKTVESLLGAQQKLAKAMVELCASGLGTPTNDGIRLAFGQQDLADIAGVGVDSVKQVTKVLREHSIIRTARQATIVRDLAAIQAIAQGDRSL